MTVPHPSEPHPVCPEPTGCAPTEAPKNTVRPGRLSRVATVLARVSMIVMLSWGLLSVALLIWEPEAPPADVQSQADALWDGALSQNKTLSGLPIQNWTLNGTEAEVRQQLIAKLTSWFETRTAAGEMSLPDDARFPFFTGTSPASADSKSQGDQPVWTRIDTSGSDRWSLNESSLVARRVVGVTRVQNESLICCWAGYDEVAPEEWSVWMLALPTGKAGQ